MSRNEARDAVHVTDQPIEEGQAVTAAVDWDRRFDHMQQHTGLWAPMLCFSLLNLSQCHTVSQYYSTSMVAFLLSSACFARVLCTAQKSIVSQTSLQCHA